MHSRKSREKDRDLRNLKRMELYLRIAEDTLGHTQLTYDKLRSQVSHHGDDARESIYCAISNRRIIAAKCNAVICPNAPRHYYNY